MTTTDLPLQPDPAQAILTMDECRELLVERQAKLEALDQAKQDLAENKRQATLAKEAAAEQAKAVQALEQDVRLLEARLADGLAQGLEVGAPRAPRS